MEYDGGACAKDALSSDQNTRTAEFSVLICAGRSLSGAVNWDAAPVVVVSGF